MMSKFSGPMLCLINKCHQEMQHGHVNNQVVLIALPVTVLSALT